MTCMTEDIYVDEIENDERGVAETFLDDSVIASNARPGTSFSRPVTSSKGPSQAIRPRSSAGRPLSGVIRPETTARPGTMEQSLRTSRTSKTARATSSSSARLVRLGTIAAIATKCAEYSDWYWKNQLGKCYYRLGMFADAIKQFQSSLNNQKMVETYAYLAKV
uniref:Uncharacterized protein n=1 Tax=Parascaris equorum TaxID=6256 RepID=A0A914R866_PAREQ